MIFNPLHFLPISQAHSQNLSCSYWIRNAAVVLKLLDTLYEITKLVKFSLKGGSHLQKIHEEEHYVNEENCSSKFTALILLNGTRWTTRAGSLTSIYKNNQELEELWRWCLTEYKNREAKARILGVQA